MKLETERLILRGLKKTDVKDIFIHANNLNIAKYLPRMPYPYSKKEALGFVNKCIKESKKKSKERYDFCICLKSDDKAIGMISITRINKFCKDGTIGYWLSERFWRQGITYEALNRAIKFAFKKLRFRRINIAAFGDNLGSNELIKKAGFVYEGTRRKFARDQATKKYHDQINYGMLKEDWLKTNQ